MCCAGSRKYFAWDDAKNAKLKADRGIGFEDIVFHVERDDLLDILEHPNPERYAGQRIFVVRREDYVYLVPFVEDEHTVFLKTITPSRKATRQALGEESDDAFWPGLGPENADRRHCCGDSRRKSQAFAKAHSRSTVAGDIPKASAASSMVSPAKNRSSTTWLCRASTEASAASA